MYAFHSTSLITDRHNALWSLLTDVPHWPAWDPHEEAARLDGAFVPGTIGWSKPRGAPAAHWVITQVIPGERWSTQCRLPGGTLSGETVLQRHPDGQVQVTRTMRVTGPLEPLFRWYFAPRILHDLERTWQAAQRELDRAPHAARR